MAGTGHGRQQNRAGLECVVLRVRGLVVEVARETLEVAGRRGVAQLESVCDVSEE